MKYYELTYLLNPNLEQPESSVEELINLIKNQEGDLESKDNLERTELGSSIKPELEDESLSEVLMGTLNFHLEENKVNSLREKMEQKKEVLRTILLTKEEQPAEPEPQPQKQQEKVELEDIDQKLDEILEE